MSVRERTYPSGAKCYVVDYYDEKKRRRSKAFKKKTLAEAFAAKQTYKKQENIALGINPHDSPDEVLFSDFKSKFLDYSKANKKTKTYLFHENSIKKLSEFFDNYYLSDITSKEIEEYKISRKSDSNSNYKADLAKKQNKEVPKISSATVNRELSCLSYMISVACEWGYIKDNPVKKIKKLPESPGVIRYLTEEEATRLIESCTLDYLKRFVIIALCTGMRRGEIYGLRWDRIDMKNKLLHVVETRDDKSKNTPKSSKFRTIPINDYLFEILSQWKEEIMPGSTDYLFDIYEIKRSFNTACRNAKIEDFRVHDLRHTAASWLVMRGINLVAVKDLLGHSTIAMTMRYAHLAPDYCQAAVFQLGEAIKSIIKP